MIYLDDVVILSEGLKEHLQHLESILKLVQKVGMSLKQKKCLCFSDAIDYLEHMITPPRLHFTTKEVDTVRSIHYPWTTSKIRSFLELCNVIFHLVLNLVRVQPPSKKDWKKANRGVLN